MQNSSSPSTYGAPATGFLDKHPVSDPNSEQAATYANKQILDTAQMTRTCTKIYLEFPTVASGTSTPTLTRTIWGNTSSYYPTSVTRSGAGTYAVVYPSSFSDDYGTTESLSFSHAKAEVVSTTVFGTCQCTISGLTINIKTLAAGGVAPADLTAGTTIGLYVYI